MPHILKRFFTEQTAQAVRQSVMYRRSVGWVLCVSE